jgi:hypothetical protein
LRAAGGASPAGNRVTTRGLASMRSSEQRGGDDGSGLGTDDKWE